MGRVTFPIQSADLSDTDLDRLVRLISVFRDDPDYALTVGHVREQWSQLSHPARHFDSHQNEMNARRDRGDFGDTPSGSAEQL